MEHILLTTHLKKHNSAQRLALVLNKAHFTTRFRKVCQYIYTTGDYYYVCVIQSINLVCKLHIYYNVNYATMFVHSKNKSPILVSMLALGLSLDYVMTAVVQLHKLLNAAFICTDYHFITITLMKTKITF